MARRTKSLTATSIALVALVALVGLVGISSGPSALEDDAEVPPNKIDKHTAVAIIGAATYAINYCREMEPDLDKMRKFFNQSGINLDAILDEPAYSATIQMHVTNTRASNPRYACDQINNSYGPNGQTYRGLIITRPLPGALGRNK